MVTEQEKALAAERERLVRRLDALEKAVAALVRAVRPDEGEPLIPTLIDQPPGAVIDLLDWLGVVYLRYRGSTLAPCWAWHAEVVEELTWLRHAHQAACASRVWVALGDWHDRYRPNAVRRISGYLAGCHIEQHIPGTPEPTVPLGDALGPIAAARAAHTPIPAPTPAQATQARTLTTRTRTNGTQTPAPSTS